MGKSRIVKTVPVRIALSGDDWIEIKSELNNGEQKAQENCGLMAPMVVEGRVVQPIDWTRHNIERALIWILDWSLVDFDDKRMKVNADSLRAIDPGSFEEINQAIVNHIMDRAAEKKALALMAMEAEKEATKPSSPTTSEPVADPTSGS